MQATAKVGFVGLGSMGLPMAINIQRGLYAEGRVLHVWNRTAEKARAVVAQGAIQEETLESLCSKCNIIFAMTFDDAALVALHATVSAHSVPGTVLVSCSTVDPSLVSRLTDKAGAVTLVSAPVFGRPDAAAAALLTGVLAGAQESCDQVEPLLRMTCKKVVRLGTTASAANVVKLSGNFCIAAIIDLLAQAQTLAEKNGVERGAMVDVLTDLFPGHIFGGYAKRIAADDFDQGFSIDGGLKDVGLVRKLAQESGCSTPFADIVNGHLVRTKEEGGSSGADWASLAKVVRKDSGL
ncbi:hypothetical protein CcCBS67573_g09068 [Chytriomyces confervae]|uniref:6-phosphogluconate dehydrogenase NADP-binding domain-containing protein n=1 Tax=Chytriomyces confervae TaxID=246404 RepID=A0A507E937_9FUNG|nr:hypothetical protein CcCBS67573_g09068 [Chytriomyces confervae]